jgi:Ribonuclease BN-like family.
MELNIAGFVREDIWLLHEQRLPPFKAIIIKSLKIAILSVQGFSQDLCPLRASALTLYSLLSIVPVIAMLFGIAKGFGFEKMLEQRLIEQAPERDTLVLQLISFAQNLLDSTKSGVIAGIGIVILFWTIISVIGNIEESFNHIWKIGKGTSNQPQIQRLFISNAVGARYLNSFRQYYGPPEHKDNLADNDY